MSFRYVSGKSSSFRQYEEIPRLACATGGRLSKTTRSHWLGGNVRPANASQKSHWCTVAKFVSELGLGPTSDNMTCWWRWKGRQIGCPCPFGLPPLANSVQ